MEPITTFSIYLMVSLVSIGMLYFHQETHVKRTYENLV